MIRWLYERITGTPYYTAAELIQRDRDELLAEIRQRREGVAR
ncbi:MAG TPA: hypothetical protein VK028_00300 [Micromonosporaceae bacterium]|nr:hypothetical protein [Micromonosporaceae bacterium]